MTKPEPPKTAQKHRDEVDDYMQTVIGTYAFAQSACWDDETRRQRAGSMYSVPRRMTRLPGSEQPDVPADVTPDAVIQPTGEHGVVAEAKKNFPTAAPNLPFEQMQKYDCGLKGWWTTTECIRQHDLALLTHVASSIDAVDAYAAWRSQGNQFDRPFAIVEFGWIEMGQPWFLLRRLDGKLSDQAHDETLRRGKKVPHTVMIGLINRYKFVDHKPPLMHMLVVIFNHIFPLFPKETEFERESGGRYPVLSVTAVQVRDKVEEQFCPPREDDRQFRIPRLEWVQEALDAFVRMGIAERGPGSSRVFRVTLRRPPKKDVIDYFASKLASHLKATAASPNQTDLFGSGANVNIAGE